MFAETEQATVNLKVILAIFAVVVVGALGYLVWNQNTAPDTTDNSSVIIKKSTKSTSAKTLTTPTKTTTSNAVACGDNAYAFSLTFGSLWKGYKIKQVTSTDAIITCYFNMPTSDPLWATSTSTNLAGYVSLFAVSVYTPTQWTAVLAGGDKVTELGHNANYYWASASAQSYPDALTAVGADVKNVVATFKIGS